MYKEVRSLALARFTSPGIWEGLGPHLLLASELLRAGRYDDLVTLAEYQASLESTCVLERCEWGADGFRLTALMTPQTPDGAPALTVRDNVAYFQAAADGVPEALRAVHRAEPVTAELQLRLRSGTERRVVQMDVEVVHDGDVESYRVSACVDPSAVGGAALGPGVWDPFIRLRQWGAGGDLTRRVGAERTPGLQADLRPAVLGAELTRVVPYWTEKANLSFDIGERTKSLVMTLAGLGRDAATRDTADGLVVEVTVPLHVGDDERRDVLRLASLLPGDVEVSAPAVLSPVSAGTVLRATLPAVALGGELAIAPGGGGSGAAPLGLSVPKAAAAPAAEADPASQSPQGVSPS
jgi:hypothetical protein